MDPAFSTSAFILAPFNYILCRTSTTFFSNDDVKGLFASYISPPSVFKVVVKVLSYIKNTFCSTSNRLHDIAAEV